MDPTQPPGVTFTVEEINLIRDEKFFLAKARVWQKVRELLDRVHAELQEELKGVTFLAPPGFDPGNHQFVKGEHLEDFPYQYLDFPKHFHGNEKFTFRSLFWWGHHMVFALIVEGQGLPRYKRNFLNRFQTVAQCGLSLCLSHSLWEWKRGEGYTLPVTQERRSEIAAVLSERSSFKVSRFVSLDDPVMQDGRIVDAGREAFRAILPIVTP